mmetsp:Transcript_24903/g.72945  ORF Transcript_24903/g.72945 Transcript_24903/m.72945 type:complete len:255 (-) Transcript_24903:6-770(-)
MLKLIFLLALSLQWIVDGSNENSIRLEPFTLNVKSKSKPETGNYLALIRKLTRTHLERKIKKEIVVETLGNGPIGEFCLVELLMKALTLDKDTEGRSELRREFDESVTYISRVTFEGLASFGTDYSLDESILYDIQLQAFSGAAKKRLLNKIQTASDEPFLADARDLTVTFGIIPSSHSLEPEIADAGEKGSGSPEITDAREEDTGGTSSFSVIIGAGAGIFLLVVETILWCYRRRTQSDATAPAYEPRRESKT